MTKNELINLLQLVSLPLEIIGISLAAIEVRFPEVAERISRLIAAEAKEIREPQLHREVRLVEAGIPLVLILCAIVLVFYTGVSAIPYFMAALVFVIGLSFLIAAYWVPGKEIGTIGIIIAIFGIIANTFQLILTYGEWSFTF